MQNLTRPGELAQAKGSSTLTNNKFAIFLQEKLRPRIQSPRNVGAQNSSLFDLESPVDQKKIDLNKTFDGLRYPVSQKIRIENNTSFRPDNELQKSTLSSSKLDILRK